MQIAVLYRFLFLCYLFSPVSPLLSPHPKVDRKFVFQGVHMLFQGNFTSKWKAKEKRQNKFVFIGRNLPIARLEAEFKDLYVKELRFPVGAVCGPTWASSKPPLWSSTGMKATHIA